MNEKKPKKAELDTIDGDVAEKPLNKKQLKAYLQSIKEKIESGTSAPIYSLASMNHLLNLPNVYELLDNENRELAKEIWFGIKASGVNVAVPPILDDSAEPAGR